MNNNIDDIKDKVIVLKKTSPKIGLKRIAIRGKVYVDVTPLLVDMGKNYPVADAHRLYDTPIKDIKKNGF